MKVVNIKELSNSKTPVLANDLMKVFFFEFEEGGGLAHHSLNGVGLLQVVEGNLSIEFDTGNIFNLKTGDVLEFKSSILHTVKALERTKVMLVNASYSN